MSSARPVSSAHQVARPGLSRRTRRLAFVAVAVGLLACGVSLLSPRFVSSGPDNVRPMLVSFTDHDTPHPAAQVAATDLRALTLQVARQQWTAATEQLARFESAQQDQLADLKARQADTHQAMRTQQTIAATATACNQAAARLEHARQLTQTLAAAQDDPSAWSRISLEAIASDTNLHRLLRELRAAQAHTARQLETRLPAHPAVVAAYAAEREIESSLQQELASVLPLRLAALQADEQQLASMRDELTRLEAREQQLAELTAEYNLYRGHVRTCETVLRMAEQPDATPRGTDSTPRLADQPCARADAPPTSTLLTASSVRPSDASSSTDTSPVFGHRTLLVLMVMCGGLFACMGYFYLTDSRRIAPAIGATVSSCPGSTPLTNTADSQCPAAACSGPTASDSAAATNLSAPTTAPETAASPKVATRDPHAARPAGRTTLRDALLRCAERANQPQ